MMNCETINEFVTPAGHLVQVKICTNIPPTPPKKAPQEPKSNKVEKKPPELHGGATHRAAILTVNNLNKEYNGCDCETPPLKEVRTPFKRHKLDLQCPTVDGDILVEIETLKSYLTNHAISQFLAADLEVIADRYFLCGVARTEAGQRYLDQTHLPNCPQLIRNKLYAQLENFRRNVEVSEQ